jgi:hypothetical protein
LRHVGYLGTRHGDEKERSIVVKLGAEYAVFSARQSCVFGGHGARSVVLSGDAGIAMM